MKIFSKELKFFFVMFFVWTLFFSVSSPVLALENSFDYVSGISYEPIAKLVNFLNDKKSELEKLGDNFGKTNTAKRQTSNTANQNNARKQFLLSAVLNTAKDAVIGKPKQYFGKVFCVAKDFVFPGACQDGDKQDYVSVTTQIKKNDTEEINALKKQYDDAIVSANELNQKFNLLQQELGKVKAGGVIIKEPIIEQKTVERTIEKIVSGLSQDDLSASIASIKTELNNLNTNLTNQINNLSFNTSRQSTAAFQAISLTNKIDSLSGTRLSGIIVNGVSGLTNADIPDDITASNYLPLTGGIISGDLTITGNATLGVITLQNATAGYFTATSTAQASTFPYASTTALTVSGSAYIGSLNGPLQANNGLVSATTSVGYQYGGTGLTATPSFGQILRGTGTGYALTATSTLGINTTDITEGSNLFWTNDRFDNRLSATTTLPNLTTLANLSITGSQVSNLNTLWDNRMSATTTLPNLTTIANLATVGTITSGTWSGSTIAVNKGGTGQTSFGQGWLNSDGTTLSASTSPTVNYIVATSTTATSTFAGGLFVAGHCVTGDTKLRRRRKKKNGEGYDYDEVEIKDIQVGDEIASLDEKTGKIVWSKVNALMDMGVKKIYKLTTASGKTIRTTAEHPYFIKNNKISSKKAIAFIDYANIKAWLRDKKLSIDLELLIKTLVSAGISDVRFYYGSDPEKNSIYNFFKKLQSFGYTVITKPIQYFKVSLFYLLKQKTNIMLLESISNAFKVSLEKEAFRMDKENVSLFAPKANFDVEISVDAIKKAKNVDVFVLFSGDGDFAYLFKELKLLGKKAVVVSGRKSLSGALIAEADKFVTLERLSDSIPGLVWSNKNAKPARRQVLKNCASNIADLLGLSNCSVDNLATNENGLWKKVVYLKEGMEIAINDVGNDKAVFDKITKIEILPEEQVYDIEVEGTHNFIGNDIVAHNTYIGGTASSTNLIVSNNSTVGTITSGIWNGTSIGDAYLTKSGDWTGTFDGQDGSYYLNASNLSNFGSPFYAFFSATNTDALTQGSTNKYWSNTLFDNRLSATTTLPNLTTLLGLTNASTTALTVTGQTTLATSLTGLLKGASGVVSAITTSLGLAGEISDETGSGALVFGTSPTFTTQITTPSIISAGALGITPASGSNLNVNLAGTGDLAVNTNQLYVDTSTGNVGIGTTAPATALEIQNASPTLRIKATTVTNRAMINLQNGSNTTTYLAVEGDTAGGGFGGSLAYASMFGTQDAKALQLFTNNSARLTILSDGNVGIGTTTPNAKFSVYGNIELQGVAGGNKYIITDEIDTGTGKVIVQAGGGSASYGGALNLFANAHATKPGWVTAGLSVNGQTGVYEPRFTVNSSALAGGTDVFTVLQSGNVGIGTTTPSSKLNLHDGNFNLSDTDVAHGMTDWAPTAVYGSMSAFSGTNGGLNLRGLSDTDAIAMYIQGVMGFSDPTDTTPAMAFAVQKKNGVVAQALGNAETAYQFKNYETNLMTILGSGNVGIGTTTPGSLLHIKGADATLTIDSTSGGTNTYLDFWAQNRGYVTSRIKAFEGGAVGRGIISFSNRNDAGTMTEAMRIDGQSGNVGIGTTTPSSKLNLHDGNFNLSDTDVVHGMTDWNPTDVYGRMSSFSETAGGLNLIGLSDTDAEAMYIQGVMGSSDPTDTTPAMAFAVQKKNGVVAQALGNAETAYQFKNYETNLMTILGSGNVGIGTTGPQGTLDVRGIQGTIGTAINQPGMLSVIDESANAIGAGAMVTLGGRWSGAATTYFAGIKGINELGTNGGVLGALGLYSADNINGYLTERMRINSSGNVGIGTTTPSSKLNLHDGNFNLSDTDVVHGMTDWTSTAVYGNLSAFSGTNGGLNLIGLSDTDAEAMYIQGVMGSSDPTDTTPAMAFAVQKKNGVVAQALGNAETAYQFKNYETNLMTILGSGNVGIGTTTPMSTLTVQAGATAAGLVLDRSSANTAEWMRFDNASVPRGYVGYDTSTGGALLSGSLGNSFIVRAENALHLVSNGGSATNGITIATNGNVGIGTTTPGAKLDVLATTEQLRLGYDNDSFTQFTIDINGDLKIDPTGSTITIPDQNLKICAGDACQTTALNSGNGNLTVENNIEIGGNYNRTCATGYIWVPGSSKFGTLPGFCTMKYEAKNDGSNNAVSTATGGPYVSIDQPTSRTKCEAVGLGYHLINEMEWMTIAENIAQTPINDMDDDAGLQLATGHSDNAPASALAATSASDPVVSGCNLSATMENSANAYSASSCEIQGDGSYGGDDTDKGFYGTSQAWATTGYSAGVASKSQLRTHILSNGNVIWDIAGNVWEWTDAYVNGTAEKPAPTADAWAEYTAITDYTTLNYSRPQNPAWTSANGIGQYYAGASAGQRGFVRGGNWNNGANAGVFVLDLNNAPSYTHTALGFRCSR